jgi:hypothetical protein
VGARIPEVGEQAVALVLRHVAAEACDEPGRALVIAANDLEVVLGVEPARQLGRADEVAEERRELTPLAGHVRRRTRHASVSRSSTARR